MSILIENHNNSQNAVYSYDARPGLRQILAKNDGYEPTN